MTIFQLPVFKAGAAARANIFLHSLHTSLSHSWWHIADCCLAYTSVIMPLEDDDQKRVDEAITEAGIDGSTKLVVLNASESHKLGPVTVICMILNRTVGKLREITPS